MTNLATSGSRFILIGTLWEEALQALFDLRWMLVLIVVLILGDFWFGVSESLQKNEKFRFSRAGRRTCNKAVDYIAYLMLGAILGLAIFEPLGITNHTVTAAVGLGFGMLWEIDSIVGHICALHGIDNKISIKKFLIALLKRKYPDAGDALEKTIEEDK